MPIELLQNMQQFMHLAVDRRFEEAIEHVKQIDAAKSKPKKDAK